MFAPQKTQKQTNDRTNAFCGVRVQNREPTALVLHTMGYLWQNGGLCMAGDYIITGGRPLNGAVRVPAAKNSVLPLLAASLLCSGPVRLCGVPELADVAESLALLRSAGCTAERQGADVRVDGVPGSGTLATGPAGRMRASILFCAPLLARLGRAQTVLPGAAASERGPLIRIWRALCRWEPARSWKANACCSRLRRGCTERTSPCGSPAWGPPRPCCWRRRWHRGRRPCGVRPGSRRSKIWRHS